MVPYTTLYVDIQSHTTQYAITYIHICQFMLPHTVIYGHIGTQIVVC